MAYTPPTALQMQERAKADVGRLLMDAGLWQPREDGTVPALMAGMVRGALAVGLSLPDPRVVADADLAVLSPFAIEWIGEEMLRHALEKVLLNWYRVVQAYMVEAVKPARDDGGWLVEQKESVKAEKARLDAKLRPGFRDAVGQVAVANPGHRSGHAADACFPRVYPGPQLDPFDFAYGYRDWGCR